MLRKIALVTAAAIVALVLAVWLIVIPSQMVHAARIALDTTPAKFGLAYENVSFTAPGGGPTIRAWWIPAKTARGIVIFVHGGNGNRREIYFGGLEIQKFLAGAGYDVLAPDLRNHGQSDATADRKITLGIDESKDVRGAVGFAAGRAPGLPIYLLGESMGGAAAIYAAADDAHIRRIVLIDPLLDAHSTEVGALSASLNLPPIVAGPIRWSADTFFAADVARRDSLATALTLRLPVLLIQDDRDPVCLPVFARQLAAGNRHVQFWISLDPDRDAGRWGFHTGAFKLHPREVERLITAFLVER